MTIAQTSTATHVPFAELDALTIGTVAVPGDKEYDALVSPWNVAVPVRPAAVLAAHDAQDVVEAVQFAARHGLRVTPQATGHGPMAELDHRAAGHHQGASTRCVVHPEGWARVGAGVKWLRSSRPPRRTAWRRCPARSPTSASSATPPAAGSGRWPAPTGSPSTRCAPSRSSPATACSAG